MVSERRTASNSLSNVQRSKYGRLTAAVAVSLALFLLLATLQSGDGVAGVSSKTAHVSSVALRDDSDTSTDLAALSPLRLSNTSITEDSSSACPIPSKTFEPLGTFQFWGKTMNASSPCPTAGMNNQLMMLMGLIHCSITSPANSKERVFRFKDITCSPTGGKEGRKQFRVGSEDYDYQWYRWSELFTVSSPAPGYSVCLADTYSWSEHGFMKRCPTFVDHIYGTPTFWTMRKSLKLHDWFNTLARQLAWDNLRPADKTSNAAESRRGLLTADSTGGVNVPRFLAIHVRRGDYENFCRQTAKSSGVKKFRTAPFVWMQKAAEPQLHALGLAQRPATLSSKFMTSCFPPTSHIVSTVVTLCEKSAEEPFHFLYVATNSAAFVDELRAQLKASASSCAKELPVVTLREYLAAQKSLGLQARHHSYWPRRSERKDESSQAAADEITQALITDSEVAMMDVNVMSFASTIVLNKYSTFSQSAIDFRVVRENSLRGMSLYWW